jgi:hypothetical protein
MVEEIVRPMGFHVALTGSKLYGRGSGLKDDLDLIFYRHDNERLNANELHEIKRALEDANLIIRGDSTIFYLHECQTSKDFSKMTYTTMTPEEAAKGYKRFVFITRPPAHFGFDRVDLILV